MATQPSSAFCGIVALRDTDARIQQCEEIKGAGESKTLDSNFDLAMQSSKANSTLICHVVRFHPVHEGRET